MTMNLTENQELIEVLSYPHWRHRILLGENLCTPGYNTLPDDWNFHHFPTSLKGKTVLDMGANDGYFSFEAEALGATSVTAADIYTGDGSTMQEGWDPTGIRLAKQYLKSQIDIRTLSVFELPQLNEKWDVVLCSDVLSWLENTREGIRCLAHSCEETLVIKDTFLTGFEGKPMLQYFGFRKDVAYRMNLEYLRVVLKAEGFAVRSVHEIPELLQYKWQDENLPSAYSDVELEYFAGPEKSQAAGRIKLNGEWVLQLWNGMAYIRNTGWVDASEIRTAYRGASGGLKGVLKRMLPESLKQRLKQMAQGATQQEQFTVIADRV